MAFARVLRGMGVEAPPGSVVTFARALGALGPARRSAFYWAARATLLHRPEDQPNFDAAFDAFWPGGTGGLSLDLGTPPPVPVPLTLALDDPDGNLADGPEAGERTRTLSVRYSPAERLADKDFAACTPDELAEVARLMAGLHLAGAQRRSRRLRPAPHGRGRPDLRATLRASLASGGEPLRLRRRAPTLRPRRIVLLVDVSGSMEAYARALLRFGHLAVAGRRGVEAFALGTRLTRLTRELSTHDPDAALAAAARSVPDWSGGTRLGEGLRTFCDTGGVAGMARGAVLVVLSDGWDRGDPSLVGQQMARLHRVAHRVVWVNPLKASPGYAPLAAGMASALPHVDQFLPGHSFASLERLAEVLVHQ